MSKEKNGILKTALWFVPASLVSGVINGLLGAGGGVLMLYIIRGILRRRENGEELQKDTFASVVAVMLPVSIVSAVTYAARGSVNMGEMQILTLPALAGGIIGAYLTDRLPSRAVRGIFAVLVIISGIRMVW